MPKLTIEVDPKAWQLLHQQAELRGLTPEALAQQLLLGELRAGEKKSRGQDLDNESLHAAALPRGSLQRVLTT